MKTLSILLSLFVLYHCTLHADSGWQNTTWGMALDEVHQAYPKAVKKDPPGEYIQKGSDYISPLRLSEYDLIGKVFFVDFLFDADHKLAGTALGLPATGDLQKGSLEIEYENLRDLLIQKYGKPVNTERRNDGSETTVWNTESTEIRLNYIVSKILGKSGIRLLYLKQQKATLDRL